MSDGIRVTAHVATPPPRDPQELRDRAAAMLRARLEEIWSRARMTTRPVETRAPVPNEDN